MRLLGAVVVAVIMYVAVPLLWERAMVRQADEISAAQKIPGNAFGPIPEVDLQMNNWVNPYSQTYPINTEEYERIAVQVQTDQAIRQAQQARDDAWRATHP